MATIVINEPSPLLLYRPATALHAVHGSVHAQVRHDSLVGTYNADDFQQADDDFDAGAIKAIYSAIDFTKDGINEVVIGRDSGSLEVYGFDQQHQPALIFQVSLEESISTVDGGFFTSPNVQVRALPE